LLTYPVKRGWFPAVELAAKPDGTVPKLYSTTVTYTPTPKPRALTGSAVVLAANGLPGQVVKLEFAVVLYRMAMKLPAGEFA